MIVNFFRFIFELIWAAGQAWQYDIPNYKFDNYMVSEGLHQYKIVYFSGTGELVESDPIEAINAEKAEQMFSETNKFEVYDVLEITK